MATKQLLCFLLVAFMAFAVQAFAVMPKEEDKMENPAQLENLVRSCTGANVLVNGSSAWFTCEK